MSRWKRIMNEDTHLLLIPKMPKNTKKFMSTQMKHDQSSYFCRGPAPVGPTLVTGLDGAMLSVCSEDTTGQWSGCGRDHCIGGRQ